ncbi:Gluconolactonase precursor [Thalassoglobus neptunius]|uniref:Gluconolactonase n=1 Tax=Thalassoglobus neptunius TaxID=1938619 RepID=A0A5C5X4E4_9PLAN|nr:SMP-30/gluconolactonase/LRE family protein [Thalassoglobus neptunius]TWT57866.1 Gluconolactonase precursor [Thalassoglobus neptunius]
MKSVLSAIPLCLIFGVISQAESPVDRSVPLEEVTTDFELCDGPSWNGLGTLFVPDVKGQTLNRWSPKQSRLTKSGLATGRFSASFFNNGELFLSDNANARILAFNGKKERTVALLDPSDKPVRRPNDLVVDHSGGCYVTLTRQNQVVYLSPDGTEQVAVENIETPNGLILSPDEKTLYVSAYKPKIIWSYPITKPGVTGEGKEFARLDEGPDLGADGMTVDRAGNIYCAGPTSVWIWSPSGEKLDEIVTPTRPINCGFGDTDMRSLYITCFGGLYKQRMSISGRSPNPPSDPQKQPQSGNRPSTAIPDEVESTLDVVYSEDGSRKLLMDLFRPKSAKGPLPAIVVVHGGGWLKGDKSKFRALAIRLASFGYVTAAVEYRLGDEAHFPAAIHDCFAAVRFLRANAERYGVDPEQIGAVGGSAGGHLVGLMATGSQNPQLTEKGGWTDQSSSIQAAIVMAGPMEMTTGSVADRSRNQPAVSNSNAWLGKTIDEDFNLYKLADAHLQITSQSAPILFMVGEHDNPDRNAPSRDKLTEQGVWTDVKVYSDGKHGCWNQLPWFDEMAMDMDAFFKAQLSEN